MPDVRDSKPKPKATDRRRVEAWAEQVYTWLNSRRRSLGLVRSGHGFEPHSDSALRIAKRMLRARVAADEAIRVCQWRQDGWHQCGLDAEQLEHNMKPSTLFRAGSFQTARDEMPADWVPPVSLATLPPARASPGNRRSTSQPQYRPA